jgi:Fic family protein
MEKLLGWLEESRLSGELHPFLVTGMFVVWFLAIHPFQEGNGRLSRLLTTQLLLRAGYSHVPHASLERVLEENAEDYHASLRQTQLTLKSPSPDWAPWLLFFLRSLVLQKNRLVIQTESRAVILPDLSPLAGRLLHLIREVPSLSVAEAVRATGANRHTAKASLRHLAARGLIEARGRGRGAHYTQERSENTSFSAASPPSSS